MLKKMQVVPFFGISFAYPCPGWLKEKSKNPFARFARRKYISARDEVPPFKVWPHFVTAKRKLRRAEQSVYGWRTCSEPSASAATMQDQTACAPFEAEEYAQSLLGPSSRPG